MAYIRYPDKIDSETLRYLFTYLDQKQGGDGMGIGGFVKGEPYIKKSVKFTIEDVVKVAKETNWDNGFLFHARMASIGKICDSNCHPFTYGSAVTAHNGHISGIHSLKLMMMENHVWATQKAFEATDSEVLSYYIEKYGFNVADMFGGVIMTMYPNVTKINISGDFESISHNGVVVFASEFPGKLGLDSPVWAGFNVGSHLEITQDDVILEKGSVYDARQKFLKEMNKRRKK